MFGFAVKGLVKSTKTILVKIEPTKTMIKGTTISQQRPTLSLLYMLYLFMSSAEIVEIAVE